jgi:hypothetical protein
MNLLLMVLMRDHFQARRRAGNGVNSIYIFIFSLLTDYEGNPGMLGRPKADNRMQKLYLKNISCDSQRSGARNSPPDGWRTPQSHRGHGFACDGSRIPLPDPLQPPLRFP